MGKYNIEDQDQYLLKVNLLGAKSYKELEQLETVAFSLRATQLEQQELNWLFPLTIESIKQMHFYLFQDIYPFAGMIRDVQLMKGKTRFCQVEFIHNNVNSLLLQLRSEPDWKSLEQAAERLAFYKSELNIIHPFREGNGRLIRIIIRKLAFHRGLDWEFNKVNHSLYMKAMIQSVTDDYLLQKVFKESLMKLSD